MPPENYLRLHPPIAQALLRKSLSRSSREVVLYPTEVLPLDVPPPSPTVLVVDDLADARDVMARLLRLGGYKSVTAEDGFAALSAVESEAPDLVLLDVTMPEMDGVEVLRRLRDHPRWRHLPVVLFTALAEGPLLEEASRLGIQDLIVKGRIAGHALLDRIARHVPRAAPVH